MSLGGIGICSTAQQNAINEINAVGAIIVVAAGNSNANASGFNPANCNGVISVGATAKTGVRAWYSNYGASIDVSTPGGDQTLANTDGILSTLNTGTTAPDVDSYAYYQGASMSTPHVVGLVSLMLAMSPTLNFTRTEAILKATKRPFGPGNDCAMKKCGTGIIDAFAALSATLPMSAANSGPTVLGQTTYLTATINSSGLTYAWAFGDGMTNSGITVNHVYPFSGTYTTVVTATNGIYTRTTSTFVRITNQSPVAFAGIDQSVTVNSLVTLDGSASTDPDGHLPLLYCWRQTGGITVTLSNASISRTTFSAPAAPSVLTFTLTVTDAQGLVSSTSARTVVTVTDTPITDVVATNDSPTTLGQTTTLTVTSNGTPGAVVYAWDFGDGTPVAGDGPIVSHIYPLAGTYTAVVTATNSASTPGVTATTTVTITPILLACSPLSDITVTGAITGLVDSLQPFTATVSPLTATLPLTYTWQADGQAVIITQTALYTNFISYSWPVIGQPMITATAANGCSTLSATTVIAIQREYRIYVPIVLK